MWKEKKEFDNALKDYTEAIRLDPQDGFAYNARAWIWATASDPKYRDGKQAVESAVKACELSEWKDAGIIDTLAAAYAEAGDFQKAVTWQTKAIALTKDANLRKEMDAHLDLYKSGKPYREALTPK